MMKWLLLPYRMWSVLWDAFFGLHWLLQSLLAGPVLQAAYAMGGWTGFGIASAVILLGVVHHSTRRAFAKWRWKIRKAIEEARGADGA